MPVTMKYKKMKNLNLNLIIFLLNIGQRERQSTARSEHTGERATTIPHERQAGRSL